MEKKNFEEIPDFEVEIDNLFSLRTLEFDKIVKMLIGYASSSIGKKYASGIKPLRIPWKIKFHQLETSEARNFIDREELLPFFSDLVDVRQDVMMAMKGSTLSISKLWAIMRTLRSIRITKENISKAIYEYPIIKEYGRKLKAFTDLENELFRSLEDEETIADKATPELQKYRHDLREKNYQIQEKSRRLARKYSSLNMLTDSTFTIRNNRYVLPFSSGAMGHEKIIIQSTSESGLTFYGEPLELVELNNELQKAYQLVRNEEERILWILSSKVGSIGDELLKSIEVCGYLDFIFAKGHLSRELEAVQPHFSKEMVNLKNARHPLIKKNVVVPINIEFGGSKRGLVITGPNAGGKTVTLKTIGLMSLIAQSGLHIPADENSRIPIFRSVLAEIGDAQSIDLDLSSFGAHVLFLKNVISELEKEFSISDEEFKEPSYSYLIENNESERSNYKNGFFSPYDILNNIGSDIQSRLNDDEFKSLFPLILIDEIGRSTDPQEGSAIALALIDRLISHNAYFAITTHLPALKNLVMQEESPVTGAAMGFNTDTMSPTYSIEKESVGASFALAIAEKMGLDPLLIEGAKERLKDRYKLLEIDIPHLEKKREELRALVENLESIQSHAKKKELRELTRLIALKKMGLDYLLASIEKAEEIVGESVRKSDSLLEIARRGKKVKHEFDKKRGELKILKKAVEDAKKALSRLESIEEKERSEGEMKKHDFEKGQVVWVSILNREGVVDEVRKYGKRLVVIIDGKKMEVDADSASPINVEKIEAKKEPKVHIELGTRKKTPLWLDLHGERVESALEKVEAFLNDAFLDNRSVVHIIHGIGTGRLRKAIHELLKKHPLVRSFRDGDASEGAIGATVVEFIRREE